MTDRHLRILMITHYFAPDGGAAAVRLHRLAKLLAARGHQVTVLTTMPHYPQGRIADAYRGKFTLSEQIDGIRVVRTWIWATSSPRLSRRLLSQLTFMVTVFLRGLFVERPDVALIEAQPMFTGFAASLVCALKRVPYVLNVSDLWPDHLVSVGALTEKHLAYRFLRWMVNGMYRRAKRIVVLSNTWARAVAQYVKSSDKIVTVRNGVDLDLFRPGINADDFRRRHGIDNRDVVLFIGALTTQNDLDTLISAAIKITESGRYQVVVVGDGTQRGKLESLLQSVPAERVRWIGWVNSLDVPQVWGMTRVMFLALGPSALYRGTIPAKLIEAMACGVPTVAAIEGEAADIITAAGAGAVVPCQDPDKLAAEVVNLLEDRATYETVSRAARRYAETNLSAVSVLLRYEELLTAVSQNQPPRA